jgi:class 3 adenylate cyclase
MAAVLFTDLVGSTDLMTSVGEGAYDELRRAHFAALRHALERAGGEEVKNTGDGVMATFGSVVDAIGGAVTLSHYLGMLDGSTGRYDDAETWFATAVAGHDRLGAPAWMARTRLEWAAMLLTRQEAGDAQRAGELLGHALAAARELGLGGIERRAVALLTDLG